MIEYVDADRLRDLTLELVRWRAPRATPPRSPASTPGALEEIGIEVELLDEVFPADADRDRPAARQ